jgi:plastocyanin
MRSPAAATNSAGRCVMLLVLLGAALLNPPRAAAASYALEVRDQNGAPVQYAVLALLSPAAVQASAKPAGMPTAIMDQLHKQFAPHVLAVQVGTAVSFPNSDDIRHHVYSFSPAKRFELRLYKGVPSAPVMFDKPGPVVLGCNIHDRMLGYIYVVPTPYFATSDANGHLELHDLPSGNYQVQIWHPQLIGENPRALPDLELGRESPSLLPVELQLGDPPQRTRDLSPLEQRFKERTAP